MKNFLIFILLLPNALFAQNDNFIVDALVTPLRVERIITVGGTKAEIQGYTNEAIQIAIDALPSEGGIVKLNAGKFIMKAPVRLKSNVKLIGSGSETLLERVDGYHSRFIIDADFGELKLTVDDASGFEVGMSVQITENVTVRNCEISGCTNMGLHPGTGSPNSLIEGNNSHDNKVGMFICWRVHHSIVKNNQFHNNSDCGISTGHKDTDVVFSNNHIYENGGDGVYFRNEDAKNSPHRNSFIKNVVENNGTLKGGFGFHFNGNATEVLLEDNTIRDNKNGTQKAAIFINKNTPPPLEKNNKMSGHKLGNIING
ncbi:MAG TPA: right-handed parallel beta-helix repeat-containing protein [Bacteroidales bacterium]|nr:right-handed parallel beta-helix repeat-containing protein [Bacteroidales bacterium]